MQAQTMQLFEKVKTYKTQNRNWSVQLYTSGHIGVDKDALSLEHPINDHGFDFSQQMYRVFIKTLSITIPNVLDLTYKQKTFDKYVIYILILYY